MACFELNTNYSDHRVVVLTITARVNAAGPYDTIRDAILTSTRKQTTFKYSNIPNRNNSQKNVSIYWTKLAQIYSTIYICKHATNELFIGKRKHHDGKIKEVIYSMLERVQPAQDTAGSVAGGRPSYHSNCGRVARSVWIEYITSLGKIAWRHWRKLAVHTENK